jgi:hypothetical protein
MQEGLSSYGDYIFTSNSTMSYLVPNTTFPARTSSYLSWFLDDGSSGLLHGSPSPKAPAFHEPLFVPGKRHSASGASFIVKFLLFFLWGLSDFLSLVSFRD